MTQAMDGSSVSLAPICTPTKCSETVVDGTQQGKYAVLATQAVMLNPSVVNLNVSFREVLGGNQAVITECYGGSSLNSNPSGSKPSSKPSASPVRIKLF